MKTRRKTLKLISPVETDFLAYVCRHECEGSLLGEYECEICGTRVPFEGLSIHKDFFVCAKCCKERNLKSKEIIVESFDR